VVPSDKLQNHEDAEIDVNACKNYLEKQEQDVELVFSDDDAKGDGTDDESEKTVTLPPIQDCDPTALVAMTLMSTQTTGWPYWARAKVEVLVGSSLLNRAP
jgi:hypothetical protein